MPHCIIEYAKDIETQIDINELMKTTHFAVFSSGLFAEENIKTRMIPYALYQTGTVAKPFVHLTMKILPGRDPQQKENLSEVVLDHIAGLFQSDIHVSVEIEEIDQQSYRKYVV